MVVRIASETIFEVEPLEEPAYLVEGVEEQAGPESAEPAPEPVLPDFAALVPAANIDNGQSVADRCALCHNWVAGGGALIGPNLYGIVGRAKAAEATFNYSPALRALGGEWSYADLFRFLEQPAVFVPGTTMAFAGLPREQDRLDLIAYMRTWADAPAPLPPPMPVQDAPAAEPAAEGAAAPVEAPAEAAPAEGEAAGPAAPAE
jgi:cytochrome c